MELLDRPETITTPTETPPETSTQTAPATSLETTLEEQSFIPSAPRVESPPIAPAGRVRKLQSALTRRVPTPVRARWTSLPQNHRVVVTLGSIVGLVLIIALVALAIGQATAQRAPATPSVPQVTVPAHQTYNAVPPAAPAGDTANITLTVKQTLISIAPGVAYNAWTFDGTVPGPILRVRQGQMVTVTIINDGNMAHSIDFHSAQTPWNVNYQPIAPGKSFSFSWRANVPGVFLYHCGTPSVMMHIANGMYGAIIVDPAQGWSPAKEYVLVQSEFYTQQLADGSYGYNNDKAMANMPDYVVFNGYADQYKAAPLTAAPSQKIRLFIVNAGPSTFSAFHVIGAIFSNYYESGDPNNLMHATQTLAIAPGDAMMAELTIPDSGTYPFVTHAFSAAMKGATGVIQVQ